MKHKAIQSTVDAYPGLTPIEREKLFIESRTKNKSKQQNDDKKHTNGAA